MYQPLSPNPLMQWAPIGVSLVSLLLSGIALGWNVYRDVILKARVRVGFAVVRIVSYGQTVGQGDQSLQISVTNHGPGPVKIEIIVGRVAPLWRRVLRRVQHFVILIDHTNPLNPKLPHKLEIGDTANLFLPHDDTSFLNGTATHIGVRDSFGRTLLAPRKDVDEAREQFSKDFPRAVRRHDV
jgi:hypothetical protein